MKSQFQWLSMKCFIAVATIEISIAISTLNKLNERKNILLNQISNANDLNEQIFNSISSEYTPPPPLPPLLPLPPPPTELWPNRKAHDWNKNRTEWLTIKIKKKHVAKMKKTTKWYEKNTKNWVFVRGALGFSSEK